MVAYVILVAIVLYGTVPVLSAQPHYAWVYKHIGVVRYLEAHGKVNTKIDIYNRWPGFFALGAVYLTVSGSPNPETYANWAECFFFLLDIVLVMAVVRAVTRDIRIAAGAGLFFVLTNWVGQTYLFAPGFRIRPRACAVLVALRHLRVEGKLFRANHAADRAPWTGDAAAPADRPQREMARVGRDRGGPGAQRGDRREPPADALHAARQHRLC